MKHDIIIYFNEGLPEHHNNVDSADLMDVGMGILRVERDGTYFAYPLNTILKYIVRERSDED